VGGASSRWIFFVNLPVGLVALALAWRLLPASAPRLGQRLDLRGLLLLSPGLALFVYGMAEAGSAGGFGDARLSAFRLVWRSSSSSSGTRSNSGRPPSSTSASSAAAASPQPRARTCSSGSPCSAR
jgi:hypothetical protein